jgi:hypothetical protein
VEVRGVLDPAPEEISVVEVRRIVSEGEAPAEDAGLIVVGDGARTLGRAAHGAIGGLRLVGVKRAGEHRGGGGQRGEGEAGGQ